MDIYEFAMKMEQDGEKLYRQLASQAADPGIRRILTSLADDEVKHYNIVKGMRDSVSVDMPPSKVLAQARNVFEQMQGKEINLEGTQIDLYHQARSIELKSRDFYLEKAEQVSDPSQKQLLLKIADEEKRHYFLLDHMLEFISRPLHWIEDAEFNHLQEY
jgi:rubrerythrin